LSETQSDELEIRLPDEFSPEHKDAVLRYFQESATFSLTERSFAFEGFDLLRQAVVDLCGETFDFASIYESLVEQPFADSFIESLLKAKDIAREAERLRADIARQIVDVLMDKDFFRRDVPTSQFLMAYCLYWWYSFSKGYTFEIEIFRDLASAGIVFESHNLLSPQERRSRHDLVVSFFRGGVKTSTYFLHTSRTATLHSDFYITQIMGRERKAIKVVFLRKQFWDEIDGETLSSALALLPRVLPKPALIIHHSVPWVVVDYALWKEKILSIQKQER
jgi:hypothetical protein